MKRSDVTVPSILVLTILVTALCFQAYTLIEERKSAISAIETRAANRAQAIANGIQAAVGQVDLTLQAIRDELVIDDLFSGPNPTTVQKEELFRDRFRRHLRRVPELDRLHVVNRQGDYVYSSEELVPTVGIADRSYFLAQKDSSQDALVMSKVLLSRVTQRWAVLLTRRLTTPQGRFAGVVVGAIDVGNLKSQLIAVDQHQWVFSLLDDSPALIASAPLRETMTGKAFPDAFLKQGLLSGQSEFRGTAMGDSTRRIWATRRVATLPLITVAGFEESRALEQWHQNLRVALWFALVLVAGSAGILFLVGRILRTTERLHTSEAFFRALYDSIPNAVAVVESGVVIDSNQGYRDLFRIGKDERRIPWHLAPPKQPSGTNSEDEGRRVYESIGLGSHIATHWQCRRSDGSTFEAEISASGFALERRSLAIVTVRDLTEQRAMESQLNQAHKLEALGQLAGGVAHDFNNMLTAILASAELLEPDETRDDQKELRETIISAAKHAAQLTNKLLAFARKGRILAVPTDFHRIVHETVALLARTIDRRISVETRLCATVTGVVGDPSQLQNTLLNLGLNARDAMPQGGTLTFATSNETLTGAGCSLGSFQVSEGEFLRLDVDDTGVGIAAEDLSRIFDPFFTTKEVGRGTGLGLAAVYGTMMSHRGAITVESGVGKGTRFSLYFPVKGQTINQSSVGALASSRRTGTVLVIEDEDLVRASTTAQLQSLGYVVLSEGDPLKGIETFRERHLAIRAVLLDMVMPHCSGAEALEQLRAINDKVPTILVSGYPRTDQIRKLVESTNVGFLQKPFSRNALMSMLDVLSVDAADSARNPQN